MKLQISSKHSISDPIARGACASIHNLVVDNKSGSSTVSENWIVKCALMPIQSNKKRKKTESERHADALFYEYSVYRNHLQSLRGSAIPDLISSVPAYAEINLSNDFDFKKFNPLDSRSMKTNESLALRYMIMEKMRAPLTDRTILLQLASQGSLGDLFSNLLTHIQQIHNHRLVYVDVKPDNFMFAQSNSSTSSTSANKRRNTCTSTISYNPSDIRILDFGLVESFIDYSTNRHRADEGGDLVGTPEYCSLNVHEGHTVSRRDDVEALGYVICDLLLLCGGEDSEKKLPWESGTSDHDIYQKKTKFVKSSSEFCRLLGQSNGKIMYKYIQLCREMVYDSTPPFESLHKLLKKLAIGPSVVLSSTNRRSGNQRLKKSKMSSPLRNCAVDVEVSEIYDCEQIHSCKEKENETIIIDDSEDYDSIGEQRKTRRSTRQNNRATKLTNEKVSKKLPSQSSLPNVAKKAPNQKRSHPIAKLIVCSGPHEGEEFEFYNNVDGDNNISEIIVGRAPIYPSRASKTKSLWKLAEDSGLAQSSCSLKLTFHKFGNVVSFSLSNLDEDCIIHVKGKGLLAYKKSVQVFNGDQIELGKNTTLLVQKGK